MIHCILQIWEVSVLQFVAQTKYLNTSIVLNVIQQCWQRGKQWNMQKKKKKNPTVLEAWDADNEIIVFGYKNMLIKLT